MLRTQTQGNVPESRHWASKKLGQSWQKPKVEMLVSKKTCEQGFCPLSACFFNLYAEYIMQMQGWMKHKLESRLLGEISITSDMQVTSP